MEETKNVIPEEVNLTTTSEIPSVETGEDLLLVQIDAFRAKAKQLQSLIKNKEVKVQELEATVRENEETVRELQEELNRKQEEADEIIADVETQVDRMMQIVKANMEQLGLDIKQQVDTNQENAEAANSSLQETFNTLQSGLDEIQTELMNKTHSENVLLYRNIQDLLKEHDRTEEELATAKTQYGSLKKHVGVVTVLVIVNIAVSVCALLALLGVI